MHRLPAAIRIALFSLAFTLSCFARLGETVEQSVDRYGVPVQTIKVCDNCELLVFRKSGFEVTACFYKGTCTSLSVSALTGESFKSAPSEAECDAILLENSEASKWGKSQKVGDDKIWKREDGGFAVRKFMDSLTMVSPDNVKFSEEEKAAEAAASKAKAQNTTSGL